MKVQNSEKRPFRSAKTLPTTHRRAAGGKRAPRPLKKAERPVIHRQRWTVLVAL